MEKQKKKNSTGIDLSQYQADIENWRQQISANTTPQKSIDKHSEVRRLQNLLDSRREAQEKAREAYENTLSEYKYLADQLRDQVEDEGQEDQEKVYYDVLKEKIDQNLTLRKNYDTLKRGKTKRQRPQSTSARRQPENVLQKLTVQHQRLQDDNKILKTTVKRQQESIRKEFGKVFNTIQSAYVKKLTSIELENLEEIRTADALRDRVSELEDKYSTIKQAVNVL